MTLRRPYLAENAGRDISQEEFDLAREMLANLKLSLQKSAILP
jgi:hypothetical protein